VNHSKQKQLRHDWERQEVEALFGLPFPELLYRAQTIHRLFSDPTTVQVSSLLNIKSGACAEDCAYCPHAAGGGAGGGGGPCGTGGRCRAFLHGRCLAQSFRP